MNGIFLTLEGGEGCGKSTQLERTAAALQCQKDTVHFRSGPNKIEDFLRM